MCFSATASFVTAAFVGAVGIAALRRVEDWRAVPLAATPIVFALQQVIEGALWLTLPAAPDSAAATGLTVLYLLVAEVFWPVHAPIAALLIEPSPRRRQFMAVCLAAGLAVALYLLWRIATVPHGAVIVEGHVVYAAPYGNSNAIGAAYLAATGLALLLSSRRTVVALGAIVLLGSAVAYVFYRLSFVSVWCFFAAAASGMILLHFEQARRRRSKFVGA